MENVAGDIIVIGAGGCGLMAALVAAKNGAQVLLLEKTDKPGGGTAFSSRGIRAAGSRRQRELKIDDSAALCAQDILRRNNGESDAVLTRRLAETSGRVADFLADEADIDFQNHPRMQRTRGARRQRRFRPRPAAAVGRTLLWDQSDHGAVSHAGRLESERGRPGPARRRLDHSQSLRRWRRGRPCFRERSRRLSAGQWIIGFTRFRHANGGARGGVVEGKLTLAVSF